MKAGSVGHALNSVQTLTVNANTKSCRSITSTEETLILTSPIALL